MIKLFQQAWQDAHEQVYGVSKQRRFRRPNKPGHQDNILHDARQRVAAGPSPLCVLGPLGRLFTCCARRGRHREAQVQLPDTQKVSGYVQDLTGKQGATVDAEPRSRRKGEPEAMATVPVEFKVNVPSEWVPGQRIAVRGPHGRVWVDAPPNAEAGASFTHRLGPTPDFKVEVPPGVKPGEQMPYRRSDGVYINFTVPKGATPGHIFDVTPPVLMVQVPEGCGAGDFVCFKNATATDGDARAWCRTRIPNGVEPGAYFAARLPPPPSAHPDTLGATGRKKDKKP